MSILPYSANKDDTSYHCYFRSHLKMYIVHQGPLWWLLKRVKSLLAMWETPVQPLGQEDPLEKAMPTHSSILAWRIPWTEESGGLQSRGCKESDNT